MLNKRTLITLVAFMLGELIQVLVAVFTKQLLAEQTIMLMMITAVTVALLVGLGMVIAQWDTKTSATYEPLTPVESRAPSHAARQKKQAE